MTRSLHSQQEALKVIFTSLHRLWTQFEISLIFREMAPLFRLIFKGTWLQMDLISQLLTLLDQTLWDQKRFAKLKKINYWFMVNQQPQQLTHLSYWSSRITPQQKWRLSPFFPQKANSTWCIIVTTQQEPIFARLKKKSSTLSSTQPQTCFTRMMGWSLTSSFWASLTQEEVSTFQFKPIYLLGSLGVIIIEQ